MCLKFTYFLRCCNIENLWYVEIMETNTTDAYYFIQEFLLQQFIIARFYDYTRLYACQLEYKKHDRRIYIRFKNILNIVPGPNNH